MFTPTRRAAALGTVALLTAAPASALAASQSAGVHPAASVNRQITLTPSAAYPGARGTAQYQVQGAQREMQIEASRLGRLARTQVTVLVNGRPVGRARVSSAGTAEMSRHTEQHQRVPTISRGSRVAVRTSTGTLVLSGRF